MRLFACFISVVFKRNDLYNTKQFLKFPLLISEGGHSCTHPRKKKTLNTFLEMIRHMIKVRNRLGQFFIARKIDPACCEKHLDKIMHNLLDDTCCINHVLPLNGAAVVEVVWPEARGSKVLFDDRIPQFGRILANAALPARQYAR